jgi:3-hydroxyacyl-CoA dehydrogenase
MNLGYGKTSTSPLLARKQAMLREHDRFVINRDRILGEAIKAIDDDAGQVEFIRPSLSMPGRPLFEEMVKWLQDSRDKGLFKPHDVNVGSEMARIVTGGDIEPGTLWSEQDFYDAERRSFLALVSTAQTRERINSMLDAGSPVRN